MDAPKPGLWRRFSDSATRMSRVPYTRQVPELDLFPDDASREQALRDVERTMTPRDLRGLVIWVFNVCVLLAAPFLVAYGLMRYIVPPLGVWSWRITFIL